MSICAAMLGVVPSIGLLPLHAPGINVAVMIRKDGKEEVLPINVNLV